MPMRTPAFAIVIAACLVPPAAAQPSPAPRPTLEPDRTYFGATTCSATPPRELGRSSVRNLRLLVASQPTPRTSTLAVWSSGEHRLSSRAIGGISAPPQWESRPRSRPHRAA